LKEIYRTLKPGGTFMMLEGDGTGNVYTDKIKFGYNAIFGYAVSVLACLQFGSQSEDALCLGTMWGSERGVRMLRECGFDDVKIAETPFLDMEILYICHK
uniref:Methyltransf_11 domain-containing protein n=1 Tax=Anisakis simplex TaxID=6269 RepID=A0A0M3KI83_ANISI